MSEEEKKENARSYVQASEKLWKEHNTAKAVQFLDKAQSCWPLPEIPALYEKYKTPYDPKSSSTTTATPPTSTPTKAPQTTSLPSSQPPKKPPEPSHDEPSFSPEQQEDALKVSRLTNYYDILGVKKDATDEDIKRAYRKLAIKLHPDKNHAPAAEDAFKKVTQAYSCLSDSQKKGYYDLFGEEGAGGEGAPKPDLLPEQVDAMFFSPDGRPLELPPKPPRSGLAAYFRFLPLICLLLLSFFFGHQSRPYSLLPTDECTIPRLTASKTPFYTSANFDSFYNLHASAEDEMDTQYLRSLHDACELEKRSRESLANEAKVLKGAEMRAKLKQVEDFAMDKCELHKALAAFQGA